MQPLATWLPIHHSLSGPLWTPFSQQDNKSIGVQFHLVPRGMGSGSYERPKARGHGYEAPALPWGGQGEASEAPAIPGVLPSHGQERRDDHHGQGYGASSPLSAVGQPRSPPSHHCKPSKKPPAPAHAMPTASRSAGTPRPCPRGSTGTAGYPPQLGAGCTPCRPPSRCRGSRAAGRRAAPPPQGHSRRWPWGWPGGTGPGGGSAGP